MSGSQQPDLSVVKPGKKQALVGKDVACFENALAASDVALDQYKSIVCVKTECKDVHFMDMVLSVCECDELCKLINANDSLSFWAADTNNKELEIFRNADTIEFDSEIFAKIIWDRIKHEVSTMTMEIANDQSDPNWERELVGSWYACGLNHDMLFAKYPKKGNIVFCFL